VTHAPPSCLLCLLCPPFPPADQVASLLRNAEAHAATALSGCSGLASALCSAKLAGASFATEHAAAVEALVGDATLERDVQRILTLARRVDAKQV